MMELFLYGRCVGGEFLYVSLPVRLIGFGNFRLYGSRWNFQYTLFIRDHFLRIEFL